MKTTAKLTAIDEGIERNGCLIHVWKTGQVTLDVHGVVTSVDHRSYHGFLETRAPYLEKLSTGDTDKGDLVQVWRKHRTHYEVVESRVWDNDAGGSAVSIHGAVPWITDAQKVAANWRMVTQGWTVYNPKDNTYGIGRKPWTTRELAQEWIDTRNPDLLPR